MSEINDQNVIYRETLSLSYTYTYTHVQRLTINQCTL
jgi:hypothetical protein